jgi:hypothetical protein
LLATYPVILLAGDMEFDHTFLDALSRALQSGSQILMGARHQLALGSRFESLKRKGVVEVLDPWTNPTTGRPSAISNPALGRIVRVFQPIEIGGDPVQYQVNRTERGWVVELVNNNGVSKRPDQPARIDERALARVQLKPRHPCTSAAEWRSRRNFESPKQIEITVGPGSSEFVEFVDQ